MFQGVERDLGVVELYCDPPHTHAVNCRDVLLPPGPTEAPPEDEQSLSRVQALTPDPSLLASNLCGFGEIK